MNPKTVTSFRLSNESLKRLETLSKEWELSKTAVIEQLLKRESEKKSRK